MSETTSGTVLYIDPSWSYCGACGQMADPYQEAHRTTPPGMTAQPPREGCGVRWTHLSSHYMGDDIRRAAQRIRPDLPWQSQMVETGEEVQP